MTDFARALTGPVAAGAAAGGVGVAAPARPSASNIPAVLNNPTRRTSRRVMGRLRLMPKGAAEVGVGSGCVFIG